MIYNIYNKMHIVFIIYIAHILSEQFNEIWLI